MASPLVYFFAGVACVLAAWFVLAGWLSLRHARKRASGDVCLEAQIKTRGVQVTIGDLVRDEALLKAARDGAAARRDAIKP